MAALQQNGGTTPLPAHPVGEGETTIGRHHDCDIVLASPAISRKHAQISCDDTRYFIQDLNSRNGTHVNGSEIHERTMLHEGDQIELSALQFTFLTENSLTELSGSWGVKPDVICVSQAGSLSDKSIRRQIVQPGDRITHQQLGSGGIRDNQVTARMHVGDGAGGWPVTQAATEKLNHVLRLMHLLRRVISRGTVITHSLECLFDVFTHAERLAIVLRDDTGPGIQVAAAVARIKTEEIEICLPVVRAAMQNQEALLYVDHLRGCDDSNGDGQQPVMRSILAVPLLSVSGESLGALQIDSHNRQRLLGKDDLEKIVVLSHVISFALEQTAEIDQAVCRAVAHRSHSDAHELRSLMSPPRGPEVRGYRISHRVLHSPDVAADLIDYTRLPDGRIGCILIDVPGRGPRAANMMALLSRLLCASVAKTASPAAAIRAAAEMLRQRLHSVPMLTSVAVAILDPEGSAVTVSVAGHCPVMILKGCEVEDTETSEISGSLLDVDREALQEAQFELADDDMVMIFTDGVTRLASPDGEVLSRAGLMGKILAAADADGDRNGFTNNLATLLDEYRSDTPLTDDVSFLTIQRNRDAWALDVPGSRTTIDETSIQ